MDLPHSSNLEGDQQCDSDFFEWSHFSYRASKFSLQEFVRWRIHIFSELNIIRWMQKAESDDHEPDKNVVSASSLLLIWRSSSTNFLFGSAGQLLECLFSIDDTLLLSVSRVGVVFLLKPARSPEKSVSRPGRLGVAEYLLMLEEIQENFSFWDGCGWELIILEGFKRLTGVNPRAFRMATKEVILTDHARRIIICMQSILRDKIIAVKWVKMLQPAASLRARENYEPLWSD